eukprot:EG_transcript_9142
MGFLEDAWASASRIVSATEQHPFLGGLLDGTLPLPCFQYYILQDYEYLRRFSDCLARLASHPGCPDAAAAQQLRHFSEEAKAVEGGHHREFLTECGVSVEAAAPSPTTLLYTSFMVRVVATEAFAEGLAALLACFWVYAHIGKLLLHRRQQTGAAMARPAAYDRWIDMYAGGDFEKSVETYKALVADAAAKAAPATVPRMRAHFLRGCTLEFMFWDAAHRQQPWPTPPLALPAPGGAASFLEELWASVQPVIAAIETMPFLTQMVDGSLPFSSFQYYIEQDFIYVKNYGAALLLLSKHPGCPGGEAVEALQKFAEVAETVEAAHHQEFMAQCEVNVANVQPSPTTLLYTSFESQVVATEGYAEALAALLPCCWVYAHVGTVMQRRRQQHGAAPARPPPYDHWIDVYAGADTQAVTARFQALVAAAAAAADDATRRRMAENFQRACVLEFMFWDAAYKQEQWPTFGAEERG